jgi:hypothetical protein
VCGAASPTAATLLNQQFSEENKKSSDNTPDVKNTIKSISCKNFILLIISAP